MDESDSVRDLLARGMAAAKGGSKEEARFFLEWALRAAASVNRSPGSRRTPRPADVGPFPDEERPHA